MSAATWDQLSKSRALTEGAKPVSRRTFQRLEQRVAELERQVEALLNHGHSYAACFGPGGQWDITGRPTPPPAPMTEDAK